jgi:hypothetical protein
MKQSQVWRVFSVYKSWQLILMITFTEKDETHACL